MILNAKPMAKVVIMGDLHDLPVSKSLTTYLNAKPYRQIEDET